MWSFYCYDDGQQPDLWAKWYLAADDATKASHDHKIDALLQMPIWKPPIIRSLKGGLVEIKVSGNVEWRLLGYFGPKGVRRAFTILLICNHKGLRYYPHDAIKTAKKRMQSLEDQNQEASRCDRPRPLQAI